MQQPGTTLNGLCCRSVWPCAAYLGILLFLPALVSAKPGFYLGVGAAQTSVGGDLDGTHSYADPSGSPQFIAGKLDAGSGVAATVGYGLNRGLAIEYLYEDTQHQASSSLTPNTTNAEFTAQVLGIRLTAPFSERFEAFLRAGYGLYEADYHNYSFFGAGLSQTGNVAFTGVGSAFGAGFELFFDELGIGVGYTQHQFTFDRAKPAGGQSLSLPSNLSASARTVDVLLTAHFGGKQ